MNQTSPTVNLTRAGTPTRNAAPRSAPDNPEATTAELSAKRRVKGRACTNLTRK